MDGKNFKRGRGTNKTPVVGIAERYGKVKAKVIKKHQITYKKLSQLVRDVVDLEKSVLVTDQAKFYRRMNRLLTHKTVNHSIEYAHGWIHTNCIESFWALLKRGIVGQFHKVSTKHLPKYINEFAYRYNNHNNTDVFTLTLTKGLGAT